MSGFKKYKKSKLRKILLDDQKRQKWVAQLGIAQISYEILRRKIKRIK